MRDPLTSKIPTETFVWPDTQKLTLGELSLPSNNAIRAAQGLLQSLGVETMLKKLRIDKEHGQDSNFSHHSDDSHAVHPITVSVSGLEHSKHMQGCIRLNATVIDKESILSSYLKEIRRRSLEAGLMKLMPLETMGRSRPLHMAVMDTGRIYTTAQKVKPHLLKYIPREKIIYKALRPDVTDLYTNLKDFVWASDFELEKLSICELGLHNFMRGKVLVGQGHREIASVPLPGVSQQDLSAVMDDVTYTRLRATENVDPNAVYDVTSR